VLARVMLAGVFVSADSVAKPPRIVRHYRVVVNPDCLSSESTLAQVAS
jgi:hypothetical protein